MATLCLLLSFALTLQTGAAWTVLQDTGFPNHKGTSNLGGSPGDSASHCADQCAGMFKCVAVSWNGPSSPIRDSNCNFKCRVETASLAHGEQAVIIHPGKDWCALPVVSNCTGSMPSDWRERCLSANLFYSPQGIAGARMPDLANGYVGYVVGAPILHAGGLFNGDAKGAFGPASHRADIPRPIVSVQKRDLRGSRDIDPGSTGQALDIERAVFLERSVVGSGIRVEERWYAHATRPSVLVHEVSLENPSGSPGLVQLLFGFSNSSADVELSVCRAGVGLLCVTGANRIPEDALTESGGNHTTMAMITDAPCAIPSLFGTCNTTLRVPPSSSAVYYFVTTVVTSLNSTDPLRDATEIHPASQDRQGLLGEHTTEWAERWRRGSISIQGDLRLAQATNASLYAIRSSIRDDWPYGLSPGGLTTNGYNGHSFWDMETWMWPPLLFLDPGSAASALQYRWERRWAAASKAASCGSPNHAYCQPGFEHNSSMLMFPWESAFTGQEVQFSDGNIGPWGEYEQHISGDISFAARQYFYSTQDLGWLKRTGYPLIYGIAALYASRAVKSRDGKRYDIEGYDINQVMGPDEYAYPVNNSAYTNTVAAIALSAVSEFAPLVGGRFPPEWIQIAEGLAVSPVAVPEGTGLVGTYHQEYDGYPKLKGPKVKQADAVMLGFPFGVKMDPATLANDLAWYEPNTDPNGPAMTWSIFAIGWFSTGNYTHARERFQRGFDPNVHPPFMVWTEKTDGGCTPFLTGAGGFLQSLVFGTSGMRLMSDRLTFNPPPPSATGGTATQISLVNFNFRGSQLRQSVTESDMEFELLHVGHGAVPLVLVTDGQTKPLMPHVPVKVARGTAAIQTLH